MELTDFPCCGIHGFHVVELDGFSCCGGIDFHNRIFCCGGIDGFSPVVELWILVLWN